MIDISMDSEVFTHDPVKEVDNVDVDDGREADDPGKELDNVLNCVSDPEHEANALEFNERIEYVVP